MIIDIFAFFNRVSNIGTHYTGALIGLGCDERTGRVLYPADDIEVAFDVNITQDDLMVVSISIYLINRNRCNKA